MTAVAPANVAGMLESTRTRVALVRKLAGGASARGLARDLGVTPRAISEFAKRHADEIAEVKTDLENELAAAWISSKLRRVIEYQADVELLNAALEWVEAWHPCECSDPDCLQRTIGPPAPNLLQIMKAKHRALRAVAEELGQLPARLIVKSETRETVRHEVVGVDLDAAFGELIEIEDGD